MTQVMTLPVFLSEEASHSGQSSGEVLDSLFHAFDAHSRLVAAQWRNPETAMTALRLAHADEVCAWDGYKRYIDGLRGQNDEWSRREVAQYDSEGNNVLPPPAPVEVLEVLQVNHHQGFDGSNASFVARVRYDDRRIRLIRWEQEKTFGTVNGEWPDQHQAITWLAEEI